MRLNQVTVSVKNIEVSYAFYQILGLIPIVKSPHYARFECPNGDATFSIHLENNPEIRGSTVVYFEYDDLDEAVQDLVGKNIEFEHGPIDQDWLWREAALRDPDGNKIILYYAGTNRKNPPWRIAQST